MDGDTGEYFGASNWKLEQGKQSLVKPVRLQQVVAFTKCVYLLLMQCASLRLLASERSERDTIRCIQIRAGAVYICMEVRMP